MSNALNQINKIDKRLHFVSGFALGAIAGVAIGILSAPRSGAETRAMASDAANDAWDSARDMYDQGVEQARSTVSNFGSASDATVDELRAKVDQARERMDQLREQLNEAIAGGVAPQAADVTVEAAAPVAATVTPDGTVGAEPVSETVPEA